MKYIFATIILIFLQCSNIYGIQSIPIEVNNYKNQVQDIIQKSKQQGLEYLLKQFVPEQQNLLQQDQTSEIPLLSHNQIYYTGQVSIGTPKQNFKMLFDTGSSDMWVIGASCIGWACEDKNKYYHNKSSTYEFVDKWYYGEYGTGNVAGQKSQDDIEIAGKQIKNVQFGECSNLMGGYYIATDFEGVIGLGFPEEAQTTNVFQRGNQLGYWANSYSLYLERGDTSTGSQLILGGVDKTLYKGLMRYYHVIIPNQWALPFHHVRLGRRLVKCDFGILSSGTAALQATSGIYNQIVEFLGVDKKKKSLKCQDVDKLKSFFLEIENNAYIMDRDFYVLRHSGFFNKCQLGIVEIKEWQVPEEYVGKEYLILGSVFLKKYYTHYDFDHGSVGIAKAVHQNFE